MVIDDSCLQQASAQVRWLGLRVGSCLALLYIHQMNQVNSHNDLGHDDSTINIVVVIIRSTSKSRPNNIREGEKCPSVRPSVRPQKVSSISMKFGI